MAEPHIDLDDIVKSCVTEKRQEPFAHTFAKRLLYTLAKDKYSATERDYFLSAAYAVKDALVDRWTKTQQEYYHQNAKRVYYLSMEFLMGRALGNCLINLGMYDECAEHLEEIGFDLQELRELENDAGLGNGGLGRLAACFLDSMATLRLPGYGYGIRYEYGIFRQMIRDGFQAEAPDHWLRYPNPWEIARPEFLYPVHFYGEVQQHSAPDGELRYYWTNTRPVLAMAYDTPIPGYGNHTVNTFRLWSSKSTRDFDLQYFNRGDYMQAVEDKSESETISKVLYPEDSTLHGKELRLKQEYFFVTATLQDILRRYDKTHSTIEALPDKVAVQLNDTHPALAVVELMRILVDERTVPWEKAWDTTTQIFAYTNHTILPEALEKWKVSLLQNLLPRHLQLIYEINSRFLDEVWIWNPGDHERVRRMSLIEEGDEKSVRMAHLCIVGSHSVNGVSELHTDIVKSSFFKDFYELYPERFNCKTNGITPRRWLGLANRPLTALIEKQIGPGFMTDLYALTKLLPFAENETFQKAWQDVKFHNKVAFADYARKQFNITVNPETMFDFQVKRMHEYKRQLLNVMRVIHHYNQIRRNPDLDTPPRTVFIAGKAAPGYHLAKLIIKLISSVGHLVNSDRRTRDKLQLHFLPNYSVSMAQKIFPAAELSEQISTAGLEASGTGNMKFMLNGALTIGTLDGANVEMAEEAGEENIFIFGMKSEEVQALKASGYNPMDYYHANPALKEVIDMIDSGFFCPDHPDLFKPIVESLLQHGDQYCLLADFDAFITCQEHVSALYKDRKTWTKMSIVNVAKSGKFSTDRTIREYAEEIWGVTPVEVKID
ncbi:glycogen phosphorylase [candidate division KSB3 bacterium]|uniref:Alpha-1,4 glucan phosphorylase n=1 Tax=candidate division KSB3 bacterium TaxID=2044937 RepID=A0A2G6E4Z1_9BACT|nr:MAG: glycogen phosphorylase [candidate division KSB3 bacterium]PIE29686.1 MAG: glycogen phosphorylase [candidate division KSB3 bacterium]